ncbi:hypothetical protein TNCV_1062321 [Trichonephila clavipes]|nr:hypothetical protein TNCV_1062321 [Trichonephila clavipes]
MKVTELGRSRESISVQSRLPAIVSFPEMRKQISLLKHDLSCPNLTLLCLCVTSKDSFTVNCKLIESSSIVMQLQVKGGTSCLTKGGTSCSTKRGTSCLTKRETSCLTKGGTSCLKKGQHLP